MEVRAYIGDEPAGTAGYTDEYGFYTITGLATGTYRVHFFGDSTHLPADNTGVAVAIPGNTTSNAVLTQAFGAIEGTVTGTP